MPATARQINITEEQLSAAAKGPQTGASYSAIEVPGDYECKLIDVNDYDKREQGKSQGWVWTTEIMGCEFKEYTSFSPDSRWKLIQVYEAFGGDASVGVNNMDPNSLIDNVAGAFVDWQMDPAKLGENEANYREIKYLYNLSTLEEPAPAEEPLAVL